MKFNAFLMLIYPHGAPRASKLFKGLLPRSICLCLKGHSRENQFGPQLLNFLRRQQWYHLLGYETYINRAITAQSWDYLVYLRDLAVHKDRLPHHKMTSQSALE